jgi:DNA replication protein DnaC
MWQAVKRLEQTTAALDPYRERMATAERLRYWREFCVRRGRRYVLSSFENYEVKSEPQRAVVLQLQDFALRMPSRLSAGTGGIVLLGPPGTGKDHLLMALMRSAILEHGFAVSWVDGMRLFARIKAAIKTGRVEELLEELSGFQILALSDPVPPRDELTAYEMSILRDIIERRYSKAMATWITTNVQTAADAKRLFTEAVLTRLIDGATQLFCDWESHRRPVA